MSRRRASNSDSLASSSMNEAMAYPFSGMQHMPPQRRGPIEGPGGRRLTRRVTWRSSTYKLMASLWVLGVLYIVWLIRDIFYLPFTYSSKHSPKIHAADDLLAQYMGRHECGISSQSLYLPPHAGDKSALSDLYCQTRCFYRWYTDTEICDILERFDGILFIGDDSLADAYAGLNILLRRDLKTGSLKDWGLSKDSRSSCRCDLQFTSAFCRSLRITSSDEVYSPDSKGAQSPYICSARVSHAFLSITSSPALDSVHEKFHSLVTSFSGQNKPIPIIQSLSRSASYLLPTAESSMDEWLALAKASGRSTPFLWVGPTAPGLQKASGDHVQANSWQYTESTFEAAQSRAIDFLGMYNATLQAKSWDGTHYGEKVALMEAMMIINWLSTL